MENKKTSAFKSARFYVNKTLLTLLMPASDFGEDEAKHLRTQGRCMSLLGISIIVSAVKRQHLTFFLLFFWSKFFKLLGKWFQCRIITSEKVKKLVCFKLKPSGNGCIQKVQKGVVVEWIEFY